MNDWSSAAVFIPRASANCNNQSETSVAAYDIRKFQTKLRSTDVLALISAPRISIYNGPLLIDNSPLVGYNSPFASDVSGLIYVDRMTMYQYNARNLDEKEEWHLCVAVIFLASLSYDRRISALIHRLRTGCYNQATGCYQCPTLAPLARNNISH